ncbi:hypothetical protein D1007_31340 [Hordeum vulgare]|nr:hypothetical protein D1007_31340 [Hordeum vulgare]
MDWGEHVVQSAGSCINAADVYSNKSDTNVSLEQQTERHVTKESCEEVGPTPSQGSQASNLRAEAEPFTPRRCTRGSKKLSEHKSNKASQAEDVLMRALGLVPDDLDVDDTVVTELQNIFDSPLRDQHVRVIAALFGKEVPPMDVLEKGSASEVLAL